MFFFVMMLVRVWIFGVLETERPTLQYLDPMLKPAGLSLCDNVGVSVCNSSIMAVILINGVPEPGKLTLQNTDRMLNPASLTLPMLMLLALVCAIHSIKQ